MTKDHQAQHSGDRGCTTAHGKPGQPPGLPRGSLEVGDYRQRLPGPHGPSVLPQGGGVRESVDPIAPASWVLVKAENRAEAPGTTGSFDACLDLWREGIDTEGADEVSIDAHRQAIG